MNLDRGTRGPTGPDEHAGAEGDRGQDDEDGDKSNHANIVQERGV